MFSDKRHLNVPLHPSSTVSVIRYTDTLISSEDENMSQLLMLNDLVHNMIYNHDIVAISTGVTQHETLATILTKHTTLTHAKQKNNQRASALPTDAAIANIIQQHIKSL